MIVFTLKNDSQKMQLELSKKLIKLGILQVYDEQLTLDWTPYEQLLSVSW